MPGRRRCRCDMMTCSSSCRAQPWRALTEPWVSRAPPRPHEGPLQNCRTHQLHAKACMHGSPGTLNYPLPAALLRTCGALPPNSGRSISSSRRCHHW